MNSYIEVILFLLVVVYGVYIFLKKSWLFDICCSNCGNSNKVKWTIRDGIKDNSRLYCFVCEDCGNTVRIRDRSLVMGALPSFEVVGKSELNDEMGTKRFLPTVRKDR